MAFEDRGRRGFGPCECYYVGLALLGAVSLIRCSVFTQAGGFVYFQPNWHSLMMCPTPAPRLEAVDARPNARLEQPGSSLTSAWSLVGGVAHYPVQVLHRAGQGKHSKQRG